MGLLDFFFGKKKTNTSKPQLNIQNQAKRKPKGRFFRSTNQKNRPFGLWFVILHNFYIGVFSWLLIA